MVVEGWGLVLYIRRKNLSALDITVIRFVIMECECSRVIIINLWCF